MVYVHGTQRTTVFIGGYKPIYNIWAPHMVGVMLPSLIGVKYIASKHQFWGESNENHGMCPNYGYIYQYVPHKAVAEVSKIGNLQEVGCCE